MSASVSGGRSRNRVHHPRRLCPLAPAMAIACFFRESATAPPRGPGVSLLRESKGGRHVSTIVAVAVAVALVVVVVAVRRGRRLVSFPRKDRNLSSSVQVLSKFC